MAIAEFKGKTIVVTGASDGIGRAAVTAFVDGGADVVMIGRNEAKTAAAAGAIMSQTGRRSVTWEIADLSRMDAVVDLAERLRVRLPRIDVLVNNAGACFLDRQLTVDGLERSFALNHLQYVVLTLSLLEPLAASARAHQEAPARVICVSSRAHRDARLDLDDLQLTRGFGGWRAYANSKLCNVLFVQALARRVAANRLVVHAMHPGLVATRFAANNGRMGRMLRRFMDLRSISPAAGADTITWLAASAAGRASTGQYWVKRTNTAPSAPGQNVALAEELWTASIALTKLNPQALINDAGLSTT